MTLPLADSTEYAKALAFEAPYLIEKLLKDHVVDDHDEAEALFTEVKRYLVLVHTDDTKIWEMYSLRVDEVWHQFILFTREYMDFCQRFFGRYVPHSPSNAPDPKTLKKKEVSYFPAFKDRYEELFGIPLPEIWFDEKSVKICRRVLNNFEGKLKLRDGGEMIDLLTPDGDVVLSVNSLARDALAFIARTGAFYVRELPGNLDDDEKTALAATLVECNVLRVGA